MSNMAQNKGCREVSWQSSSWLVLADKEARLPLVVSRAGKECFSALEPCSTPSKLGEAAVVIVGGRHSKCDCVFVQRTFWPLRSRKHKPSSCPFPDGVMGGSAGGGLQDQAIPDGGN